MTLYAQERLPLFPSEMSNFFPDEPDFALMSEQEAYGQFYPHHTSQPQPHMGYIPAHAQHALPQHPIEVSRTAPYYQQYQTQQPSQPQPYGYTAAYPSPYVQQPHWAATAPATSDPGQIPYQYQTHSSGLQATNAAQAAASNHALLSRSSRSSSYTSSAPYAAESSHDVARAEMSRSSSPNSADLRAYGYLNKDGTWTCAYPGCTSRAVFTRGCDLRKHHKRHTKSFFCHHEGCPQSTGGGFSSKKDLARHEAKHNPGVICEWEGCDRVFSRVDNMRDHVKRIHMKGSQQQRKS